MLFGEIIAAFCDNHTKAHKYSVWEKTQSFNVEADKHYSDIILSGQHRLSLAVGLHIV
jgi:hypothetical protein